MSVVIEANKITPELKKFCEEVGCPILGSGSGYFGIWESGSFLVYGWTPPDEEDTVAENAEEFIALIKLKLT